MTFFLLLVILVYFIIRMKSTINKLNELKLNEMKPTQHHKNTTRDITQLQDLTKYNNFIYFGDHALGHIPLF